MGCMSLIHNMVRDLIAECDGLNGFLDWFEIFSKIYRQIPTSRSQSLGPVTKSFKSAFSVLWWRSQSKQKRIKANVSRTTRAPVTTENCTNRWEHMFKSGRMRTKRIPPVRLTSDESIFCIKIGWRVEFTGVAVDLNTILGSQFSFYCDDSWRFFYLPYRGIEIPGLIKKKKKKLYGEFRSFLKYRLICDLLRPQLFYTSWLWLCDLSDIFFFYLLLSSNLSLRLHHYDCQSHLGLNTQVSMHFGDGISMQSSVPQMNVCIRIFELSYTLNWYKLIWASERRSRVWLEIGSRRNIWQKLLGVLSQYLLLPIVEPHFRVLSHTIRLAVQKLLLVCISLFKMDKLNQIGDGSACGFHPSSTFTTMSMVVVGHYLWFCVAAPLRH